MRERALVRATRAAWLTLACATLATAAAFTSTESPAERFRRANEAARAGDYPRAVAGYRELAGAGERSASLYWNWAQVSQAQGARGAAMWALMRARELEPSDPATSRAIERLREELGLEAAEITPEPLAGLRRVASFLHFELLAGVLLVLSLGVGIARRVTGADRGRALAWASFLVGAIVALAALLGSAARPTAVVLRRNAPLLEAASTTAEAVGTLREGEVVPILAQSAGYLRLQDSSGARGWASEEAVAPLE
jgi:hypothetical protein